MKMLLPHAYETRLPSGLRVITVDAPGAQQAVCVSLSGGGSRQDPRGQAGVAHLTEHLLTQGLRAGQERYVRGVVSHGGDLSAKTHPEHLAFHTEVPMPGLIPALEAEAARWSTWLPLREGEFASQRDGVCTEIAEHLATPGTGPLPWPELGERLFGGWAGHDPYGVVKQVAALSERDCEAFWATHLLPDRTVLVVLADFSAVDGGRERVLDVLRQVPARSAPPGPRATSEVAVAAPTATGMRDIADWGQPCGAAAVAWQVPSIAANPAHHAAVMTLAALVGHRAGARGRLGHTAPLATRDGDAVAFVATDPLDPARRIVNVLDAIHSIGEDGPGEDLAGAVMTVRRRIATLVDNPRTACELLARGAYLGESHEDAQRWVDALINPSADDVQEAAAKLSAAPYVGAQARVQSAPTRPSTPAASTPCTFPQALVADVAPPLARWDRPSSLGHAAVRAVPVPEADLAAVARRGSQLGARVTRESAGLLVSATVLGSALDAADRVRQALGDDALVVHGGLCGADADSAQPWTRSARPAWRPAPQPGVRVVRPDFATGGWSRVELAWYAEQPQFIERWLGVALLADVQARSQDRDPNMLGSPEGIMALARQNIDASGRSLACEITCPTPLLGAALEHVFAELSIARLTTRARALQDTASAIAGQWLRTRAVGADVVQRCLPMLDHGASLDDVAHFYEALHAVDAEAVVHRLVVDTASCPVGTVYTDLADAASLLPEAWLPHSLTA